MNTPKSLILINDPGVDGAFAISMALLDPRLEVAAILATAGNVSSQQATRNVRTILDQMDPPRIPRLGIAPPAEFDVDGRLLHGANGLAGLDFPAVESMHTQTSDRLLVEMARSEPEKHNLLLMGPATVLAAALDREPQLPKLLNQVVVVGGSWKSAGNCGPGVDFHFRCDPESARKILHAGFNLHLLPLDLSGSLILPPTALDQFSTTSPTGRFLRPLVQSALRLSATQHGVEGFPMKDLSALLYTLFPEESVKSPMPVDVETKGELTKGMSVFDARWATEAQPNAVVVHHFSDGLMENYLAEMMPYMDQA